MIKKISHINLAVFRNFVWKDEFFNKVNIIYGRNYSGKTTLSRIFRAMETGNLSDKYEKPSFSVYFEGGTKVTQDTYGEQNHEKTIRVFNEDFIRENLRFISDSNDNITSFAVFGEKNIQIEEEIERLRNEIGSDEDGKETGLYAQHKGAKDKFFKSTSDFDNASKNLDILLHSKATRGDNNIKDNKKYGDPRFDITKLKTYLDKFIIQKPQLLTEDQCSTNLEILKEEDLSHLEISSELNLEFQSLVDDTKSIITRDISKLNKINKLVDNPSANKWVDEGRKLHETDPRQCLFCDNKITSERWAELKEHFDKESEKLKSEIDALIPKIKAGKITVPPIDERGVYSTLKQDLRQTEKKLKQSVKEYNDSLDSLLKQISNRGENLLISAPFECPEDVSQNLTYVWKKYWKICHNSNEHKKELVSTKKKIREKLLLDDLYKFFLAINYEKQKRDIERLEKCKTNDGNAVETIKEKIQEKRKLIQLRKRELSDEGKGAEKINKYLGKIFDKYSFSISVKDGGVEGENSEHVFFKVTRDGKTAYHLSQGEQNLLAFCYFMAKLEDVETVDSNPTIWIDDPISSLDGNHIFFVYSLIDSEIVSRKRYEQIFLSTHSLEFLRYLSQLGDREYRRDNCAYFLIERLDKNSTIRVMPKYIKEFFTEFNYLFLVIYKCAYPKESDEKSLSYFYVFGNSARRFLEIYLYYKYPTGIKFNEKLELFFRDGSLVKLINRIINEYSHSKILEGGLSPNESEIKTVAKKITDRLRETDKEQYEALCKSIETDL